MLKEKIKQRKAVIAILGLGYVGLPNLISFCSQGFQVIGIDTNSDKIAQLKKGHSYIEDVSSEKLKELKDFYKITTDFSRIKEADIVIIDVPTPITDGKVPNLTFIEDAAHEVITYAHSNQLIILESTVSPGTTRSYFVSPLLDKGFVLGNTIHVVFSPERVDPGNLIYPTNKLPRVLGGATETCASIAHFLMGPDTHIVSTLEEAELTKLYENTFRFVNIALANEMARIAELSGIEFKNILNAASTKPFGFMPFYPTPVIGGHCIPVDPYYLINYAHKRTIKLPLIEMAGQVNDHMLDLLLHKIMKSLNDRGISFSKANIALVGATYKKNISDTRMAASHLIADRLLDLGTIVTVYDPLVVGASIGKHSIKVQAFDNKKYQKMDLSILLVAHASTPIEIREHAHLIDITFSQDGTTHEIS